MKILIVTTEIGLDGGGMSLSCSKVKDILSENHEVFVTTSSDYSITTAFGGISPYTPKAIQKEYKLKQEAIQYNTCDVVLAFGARFNGYFASLLARKIRARFILCLRGSDINLTKWSFEDSWYLEQSCSNVSKIICLSTEMIDNLLMLCPSVNGKTLIIPNEMAFSEVCFSPCAPSSHPIIGCAAAHLNEKKGIGNLLCMLACYKERYGQEIELRLIGDIDDDLADNYKNLIVQYCLDDNVVFKPCMNRSDLVEEMHSWDLYVQGSVCEGHPNSIVEALNEGCGFISSKTGYISELLSKGFPDLFFRSWNPSDMADDLHFLLNNSNKHVLFANALHEIQVACNKSEIESKWNDLFSHNQRVCNQLDIEHIITVALHDIQGEVHDSVTTPTKVFEQFVDFVHQKGYSLCSMKDYTLKNNDEKKSSIVCTFDDGYSNLATIAAPILDKYGYTATVFVCTGLIGADNKWNNKDATLRQHLTFEEISLLLRKHWEIASHGVMHKNLLKLSDVEIECELETSKKEIERLAGFSLSYAYPYGAFNKFIQQCVRKYYRYAFAVNQGGTVIPADSMQIRRYSITDIYQMLK